MIALITGGAGFIGSHLAERLVSDGHEVWCVDDLSTGSRSNLGDLLDTGRVRLRVASITEPEALNDLVETADTVWHLAAAVGVKLIIDQPARTIETNVRGTEVVLEAAARHDKPVLLTSSSEVYGKGAGKPFREDDDLRLGPTSKSRWGYACSKAVNEYLGLALAAERQLPVVIVRLFNTVGPRQTGRYGMVLPRFAGQGLRGEPITVYGTGEQQRCFTYVEDVVECLVRLMAEPTARGRVVNVGSRNEVSINRLAEVVRARTGDRSEIVHIPYREAYGEGFEDLHYRVPHLDRLHQTIGFVPERPIEEIVERVVAHIRAEVAR